MPLDDGCYAILAMHSGLALDVQGSSKATNLARRVQQPWMLLPQLWRDRLVHIVQYPYHGGDNQRFAAEDAGDGSVYFIAQHSNKVITEFDKKGGKRVGQEEFRDGTGRQLWRLDLISRFPVPKLPRLAQLPEPMLSKTGYAPKQYPKKAVTTAAALIPAVCVNDRLSMRSRLKLTPYYTMTREQYWLHKSSKTLADEQEAEVTHSWSSSQTVQITKNLNMTIGADLGFKFEGISLGIRSGVSEALGVSETSDNRSSFSETLRVKLKARVPGATWHLYVLCNRFSVHRADGRLIAATKPVEDWNDTRELQHPSGAIVQVPL